MMVGSAYTNFQNATGKVDRVDFFGGATFATNENNPGNPVSLGNFIYINNDREIDGNFDKYVTTHPLYMHEYGHTVDSQLFGLNYLYIIGVSSIFSALGDGDHSYYWTEKRANNFAAKYFEEHFGIDWTPYEIDYPR